MIKLIQPLRRGDTIRADWLNGLARAVNNNTRVLAQIGQDQISAFEQRTSPYAANGGGGGSAPTSLTLTETSRSTASYVVTDSNSDTATVYTTTQIIATGSWGGGGTCTFTLNTASPT